jgi:hypothetical protein
VRRFADLDDARIADQVEECLERTRRGAKRVPVPVHGSFIPMHVPLGEPPGRGAKRAVGYGGTAPGGGAARAVIDLVFCIPVSGDVATLGLGWRET